MKFFLLRFLAATWFVAGLSAAEWSSLDMSQFYVTPGTSAKLTFQVKGEDANVVSGELFNYSGTFSGAVTLRRTQRDAFELKHSFPTGFYELKISGAQQKFGIVSIPPFPGKSDPFFGMETLFQREGNKFAAPGFAVLKRSGIHAFREYHPWHYEEREKGKWTSAKSEEVYDAAARIGMTGVFFYGAVPEWTGRKSIDKNSPGYQPYPEDLIGVGDSTVMMLERRRHGLDSFQIWNEPDIKQMPSDQYISLLAAVSYVLQKHKMDLPLVGAGFSSGKTGEETLQQYFDSQMPEYIDVFAFHSYSTPEEMLRLIRTYNRYLENANRGGIPLWITECGKPWHRGIVNPKQTYGGKLGKLRADIAEDQISARSITLKGVEAKAGGVARYFPFTMRFFAEGSNNFGMTDFQWSPHRSMAAYLFSIQQLANKEYIGDLTKTPPGAKTTRVFSGNGEVVAVFDAGDGEHRLNLKELPLLAVYAPDGRLLESDSSGCYPINGFAYARLNPDKISGKIKEDTPLRRELAKAKNRRSVRRPASPVVYRFNAMKIQHQSDSGYLAEPEKLEFVAYNLSDQEQSISPELLTPQSVVVLNKTGDRIIPPRTSVKLNFQVDASANHEAILKLQLRDQKNHSAPLILTFLRFGRMRTETMELMNPKRWKANSSGESSITFDSAENALHFHNDFRKINKNYWTYPEYIFTSNENRKNLIGVSFEIKAIQTPAAEKLQTANVMAVFDLKNKYKAERMKMPNSDWTKQEILFPADWKTEEIKKFRIGMNPVSPVLDYWVRNLKFHYKEPISKRLAFSC